MQSNASSTTTRPVRQAKIKAMEGIREYTQRQAMLKSAGAAQVPKEDEYGLLDTDSDDDDYVDEGSEDDDEDEDEDEDEDDDEDDDEDEDEDDDEASS